MKRSGSVFTVFFAAVMLICVLYMFWYIPSLYQRRFSLTDTQSRLESMQGQVRKQKYEYEQTVASLPEVQAELDRITPLNEAAEAAVRELKNERKKLRNEKKELTEQSEASSREEDAGHE